ncbi:hypothetical protein [Mameliella sp.]
MAAHMGQRIESIKEKFAPVADFSKQRAYGVKPAWQRGRRLSHPA